MRISGALWLIVAAAVAASPLHSLVDDNSASVATSKDIAHIYRRAKASRPNHRSNEAAKRADQRRQRSRGSEEYANLPWIDWGDLKHKEARGLQKDYRLAFKELQKYQLPAYYRCRTDAQLRIARGGAKCPAGLYYRMLNDCVAKAKLEPPPQPDESTAQNGQARAGRRVKSGEKSSAAEKPLEQIPEQVSDDIMFFGQKAVHAVPGMIDQIQKAAAVAPLPMMLNGAGSAIMRGQVVPNRMPLVVP